MTPVGDAALRTARRDRVFAAIAPAGLDVLVLSRRDSVTYATGARSLWTAGTRPFGAACVLVSATRAVYLLSTWDAGVPPEVPFEHLYGVTWNPSVMANALRKIEGLPEARSIGVDALSPGFVWAAGRLAPGATLVAADDLIRGVRAVKLPAEVDHIRTAVAVARDGVEAATAAVDSGAGADAVRAAVVEALAAAGVTVPASGIVVTPRGPLVQVDVGVLVDGYEGGLGRTLDVAGPDGALDLQQEVVAACRPGRTGREIRRIAAGASDWMVRGSGMGLEPPVITASLGEQAVLQEGMVLSVEVGVDGHRRRDLIHVGRGPLTRL